MKTNKQRECNDKWCCMHGDKCQKVFKHGLTCHTHFDPTTSEDVLTEKEIRKAVKLLDSVAGENEAYIGELPLAYKGFYQHFFISSGFDIDAKHTADGKPYYAPRRHACLINRHWCFENFKERPLDIFVYIKKKLTPKK